MRSKTRVPRAFCLLAAILICCSCASKTLISVAPEETPVDSSNLASADEVYFQVLSSVQRNYNVDLTKPCFDLNNPFVKKHQAIVVSASLTTANSSLQNVEFKDVPILIIETRADGNGQVCSINTEPVYVTPWIVFDGQRAKLSYKIHQVFNKQVSIESLIESANRVSQLIADLGVVVPDAVSPIVNSVEVVNNEILKFYDSVYGTEITDRHGVEIQIPSTRSTVFSFGMSAVDESSSGKLVGSLDLGQLSIEVITRRSLLFSSFPIDETDIAGVMSRRVRLPSDETATLREFLNNPGYKYNLQEISQIEPEYADAKFIAACNLLLERLRDLGFNSIDRAIIAYSAIGTHEDFGRLNRIRMNRCVTELLADDLEAVGIVPQALESDAETLREAEKRQIVFTLSNQISDYYAQQGANGLQPIVLKNAKEKDRIGTIATYLNLKVSISNTLGYDVGEFDRDSKSTLPRDRLASYLVALETMPVSGDCMISSDEAGKNNAIILLNYGNQLIELLIKMSVVEGDSSERQAVVSEIEIRPLSMDLAAQCSAIDASATVASEGY